MHPLDSLHLVSLIQRAPSDHKGDNGRVLLIGGDKGMSGALVLCGKASLLSGAGWTLLMMLDASSAPLINAQPELMVHNAHDHHPKQALETLKPDVIAIGPGMGQSERAKDWLLAAMSWNGPLVMDADALNLIAQNPLLLEMLRSREYATTLTPHPGEAARLLSISAHEVQTHRHQAAWSLSALTQCHIVLKGHHTLLSTPGQEVLVCQSGNAGLAVGGMGDVLTGLIAALAAQGLGRGLDLWQATCLGVELHAKAADMMLQEGLGPIGMTPSELTHAIRKTMNLVLSGAQATQH